MAYKKKNLTPAQRSEQARKAAAARKHHRGGRPKGSTKDPSQKIAKHTHSIAIYDEDYKIINTLAFHSKNTIAGFIHKVASSLKSRNPQFFDNSVSVQISQS